MAYIDKKFQVSLKPEAQMSLSSPSSSPSQQPPISATINNNPKEVSAPQGASSMQKQFDKQALDLNSYPDDFSDIYELESNCESKHKETEFAGKVVVKPSPTPSDNKSDHYRTPQLLDLLNNANGDNTNYEPEKETAKKPPFFYKFL